jgi:hypothetical protein
VCGYSTLRLEDEPEWISIDRLGDLVIAPTKKAHDVGTQNYKIIVSSANTACGAND